MESMKEHRGGGTFGVVLSPRGFLVTATLVVLSDRFLDERIALSVYRLIGSHSLLSRYFKNIPDLLLPFVLLLSAVMWVSYLRRLHSGIRDDRTWFFRLSGCALPIAYVLKILFKHVFGRITTRAWLENPTANTFHWFHGGGQYSGFPSGHMVVFTSLAGACWIFFPRYRLACISLTLGLGIALIATDYHFLSDVIAGGYLGLVVVAATHRIVWTLSR
jgi:membrane-associated phospholipid phosphatase